MYKRLPAYQINKEAWDACVHQDPAGLVYALTWYLDIVAPAWEGIVATENNLYSLVMPLPIRRIAGFSFISQPLFAQQSGIFSVDHNSKTTAIPAFISLAFSGVAPVEYYSFKSTDYELVNAFIPLQKRLNYILPLNQAYGAIYQKYNANRIRDLKKAMNAKLSFQEGDGLEPAVVQLIHEELVPRLKQKQQTAVLKILPTLISEVIKRGFARIAVVLMPNGQIVAGAFFIHYKNRLIYLLPASSPTGKKVGASTFLLDQICRKEAGKNLILDLEGSSLPGVARFYQSLGAQPETYGLLTQYRYPLWLKQMSALRKWWLASRQK